MRLEPGMARQLVSDRQYVRREALAAIRKFLIALLMLLPALIITSAPASAQQKPNIVIIWGDDIGQSDIRAGTAGLSEKPRIPREIRAARRSGLQSLQH